MYGKTAITELGVHGKKQWGIKKITQIPTKAYSSDMTKKSPYLVYSVNTDTCT